MRPSNKTVAFIGAGVIVLAAASWWLVGYVRETSPYRVDAAALSGWKLVVSEPDDPGVVALEPPAQLSTTLLAEIGRRTNLRLSAPMHASVPLVLQSEYSDSLQGVMSVDDIVLAARDVNIESARFEPVCMGRRRNRSADRDEQLYFVVLQSPAFDAFRERIIPQHPEHGGITPYDPGALGPILTIGSTNADLGRWWPLVVDQQADCRASLRTQ